VAVILDDRGSGSVAHRIVLAAVQLDRQPRGAAGEVGDVKIDLELADELLALEATSAKALPENFLDIGLVGAKAARDRSQAFPSHRFTPSPNPLPPGERAS